MKRTLVTGALIAALAAAVGTTGGYWLAQSRQAAPQPAAGAAAESRPTQRRVLYWYDPMMPQQHFDKPGKSPYMDMELVPRYADEAGDGPAAVSIDAGVAQNLGLRLASVTRGTLASSLEAAGVLQFNGRDVALVQTRAGGFVERVYRRAPGDVLPKGAPLADLLVPEWTALQEEFLALRRSGNAELLEAARRRLRVAGMPAELIRQVERGGEVRPVQTVVSPIGGALDELNVREGMTLAAGAPLARINGLDTVWLEVAVPEAQGGEIRAGQKVAARLPALPGESLEGSVAAVLPAADAATRTLRVRIELPNRDGRLHPGLTAYAQFAAGGEPVLQVPSEAVIRTGKRALVMLAEPGGRYRPVEVRLGREGDGRIAVLQGLEEGQQVVASGQFLLDSEASLKGIVPAGPAPAGHERGHTPAPAVPADEHEPPAHDHGGQDHAALHESRGRILALEGNAATIAHGPFPTLGMPGMTMTFEAADPALLQGLKQDDAVRFAVAETDGGLQIRRIEREDRP